MRLTTRRIMAFAAVLAVLVVALVLVVIDQTRCGGLSLSPVEPDDSSTGSRAHGSADWSKHELKNAKPAPMPRC